MTSEAGEAVAACLIISLISAESRVEFAVLRPHPVDSAYASCARIVRFLVVTDGTHVPYWNDQLPLQTSSS